MGSFTSRKQNKHRIEGGKGRQQRAFRTSKEPLPCASTRQRTKAHGKDSWRTAKLGEHDKGSPAHGKARRRMAKTMRTAKPAAGRKPYPLHSFSPSHTHTRMRLPSQPPHRPPLPSAAPAAGAVPSPSAGRAPPLPRAPLLPCPALTYPPSSRAPAPCHLTDAMATAAELGS
jgi:hypothetical protein